MANSQDDHHANRENISLELRLLVLGLLKSHLRSLRIDVSERGIALSGECDSFHAKQMVQEIVSKSTSLRILSNDIVVKEARFGVGEI